MRSAVLLSVASVLVATSSASDAPAVTENPSNIGFTATLPSTDSVKGDIQIYAPTTGDGATVQVDLTNLPATGGPFAYHIHVNPVNSSGSCDSTGGHLDPYNAGTETKCDATNPASCQVGDLSGKHGAVESTGLVINYEDAYLSLVQGTPAFIGNRSLVVHDASGARIACANFVFHNGGGLHPIGGGSAAPTGSTGGNAGNSTGGGAAPTGGAAPSKTGASPSVTPTGAAGVVSAGLTGVFGVLAAVGAAIL